MPMGLRVGLTIDAAQSSNGEGEPPAAPEGFAFVVTDTEEYVTDADGAYVVVEQI